MKMLKSFITIVFLAEILSCSIALADTPKNTVALVAHSQNSHKPVTQELIALLKKHPELKTMLESSIAKAKKINPDSKTNPVQNLSDYYHYVDSASELIPSEVLSHPKNLLREQIMQSLCYFYFLIDQPLSQLEGKGLYNNTIQYYEPFSSWTRKFANAWGMFLDTDQSWSEKTYQEFYKDPRFGLQKEWYEPASNWKTFNDFFSRYLKSAEMRPIAVASDPAIVVAPADSVPQGTWAIDKNSKINQVFNGKLGNRRPGLH